MVYLIFRVYSEKERPGELFDERVVMYGWTTSKNVVKAFLSQRSKKKYRVKKADEESIESSNIDLDPSNMIDYVELKMAHGDGDGKLKIFTTGSELCNAEKDIQYHFRDMCRLVDIDDGRITLLELYVNLDDYYLSALEFLGFIPPEMESLFDSVEYRESTDSLNDTENLIEMAYEAIYDAPYEIFHKPSKLPGQMMLENVSQKIVYSVENFIKVMKEAL